MSLSSVRGKRLIAARQGYHLGWAEMNKQGLGLFSDPAQLILVNPDLTGRQEFQALLAGDADVALLPATGIVEQAIALGNLPRGVVKFINLQPAPPGFPFAARAPPPLARGARRRLRAHAAPPPATRRRCAGRCTLGSSRPRPRRRASPRRAASSRCPT